MFKVCGCINVSTHTKTFQWSEQRAFVFQRRRFISFMVERKRKKKAILG